MVVLQALYSTRVRRDPLHGNQAAMARVILRVATQEERAMTDELDDLERRDAIARAKARMELEGAGTTSRRWNVVIVVAALLFAGWAYYAFTTAPAGNPPAETTGQSERAPPPSPPAPPAPTQ
jgi:hypothetical protein